MASVLLLGAMSYVGSAFAFTVSDLVVIDYSNPEHIQARGNYVTKEYSTSIVSTSPITISGNEASFSNHFGWMQAMKVDQPEGPNFALLYRHNIGYQMEFTVEDPLNQGYTISVDDTIRGYVTVDMTENIRVDSGSGLMLGKLDVNDGNGAVHYAGFAVSGGGATLVGGETPTTKTNFIEKSKSYTFKELGNDRIFYGTNTYVIHFSSFPSPALLNLFQNFGGGEGAIQFGVLPTFANAACNDFGRHCVNEPSQSDFDFAYDTFNHDLSELGHFVTVRVTSLGQTNQPPVAVVNDVTVDANSVCNADANIDAGSFDPDGNPVTITQSPLGPYSVGNTLVNLTISDGIDSDSAFATVTVVDNEPPEISAPDDVNVEVTSVPSVVNIGDAIADDNCSVTVTNDAPVEFPLGDTIVTWTATDASGNQSVDTQIVTVELINLAPICDDAMPSQSSLWPPNSKFVAISIDGVTDPDGDPVSITIDAITQDEAVDAQPDGEIDGNTANLRAERSGNGDGRVYNISFTADDGLGGTCSGSVDVGVPHDKKDTAKDSGQNFDSTLP